VRVRRPLRWTVAESEMLQADDQTSSCAAALLHSCSDLREFGLVGLLATHAQQVACDSCITAAHASIDRIRHVVLMSTSLNTWLLGPTQVCSKQHLDRFSHTVGLTSVPNRRLSVCLPSDRKTMQYMTCSKTQHLLYVPH